VASPGVACGSVIDDDDIRRIALALPEVTERPSYGTPAFRVGDVPFARLHDRPGVVVVWTGSVAERDALIAASPEKYFTTPHYDGHPSVLMRLDAIDEDEAADLLAGAWATRAPAAVRRRHTEPSG